MKQICDRNRTNNGKELSIFYVVPKITTGCPVLMFERLTALMVFHLHFTVFGMVYIVLQCG